MIAADCERSYVSPEANGRRKPRFVKAEGVEFAIGAPPPDALRGFWGYEIFPFIERIARRPGAPCAGEICHELLESRAAAWMAWDGKAVRGVVVTRMHQELGTTAGRIMCIWGVAGRFDSRRQFLEVARAMLNEIENWSRELGCSEIVTDGRRGLKHLLFGYYRRDDSAGYFWRKRLTKAN